ncbi:MAG: DUF4192 family protein [Burkholderiaceae bacterium]|nr:DUF4192 family protein [Microbacteriaceae bacterium]
MTKVVKAREAQDFLALLPQIAGYQPRNSIMLVAFTGNRTCAVLRFDLPGTGPTGPVASTMVGFLCKVRAADAVVPVIYTDRALGGSNHVPYAGLMLEIVRRAERSGFLVRDALCVGVDGWATYQDRPGSGMRRPLDEITASPIHREVPSRPLGLIADGAELPPADLAVRERVARILVRFEVAFAPAPRGFGVPLLVTAPWDRADHDDDWNQREGRRRPGDHLAGVDHLRDLPLFFEQVLDGAAGAGRPGNPGFGASDANVAGATGTWSLDDFTAALLIWCAGVPAVRTAAMLQWAFGRMIGEAALDGGLRSAAPVPTHRTGGRWMGEPSPDGPDGDDGEWHDQQGDDRAWDDRAWDDRAWDDRAWDDPAGDENQDDAGEPWVRDPRDRDPRDRDPRDRDPRDRDPRETPPLGPYDDPHPRPDIASLVWGNGPRPDPDRIEVAIWLIRQVAARSPRSAVAPLLGMLAWLHWSLGRSSLAARLAARAIEVNPGDRFAHLLLGVLGTGRLPEWAFATGE